MSKILYVVGKDARRLWQPLVLWLLLITAQLYTDWRLATAFTTDAAWHARFEFLANLFLGLQAISGYLMAAGVIMEDLPMGTSTFWMTRPISGARLLAAKAIGCGLLFVVTPVLVSLPWFVAQTVGTESPWIRAGGLFVWQAWTTAVGIVIATFSANLGKFLAWTVAFIFAVLILQIALSSGRGTLLTVALRLSAEKDLGLVGVWPVVIGAAVALLVQYQTRRTNFALMLLGAGAAVTIARLTLMSR